MIVNLSMTLRGRGFLEESAVIVIKMQISYLYVGCIIIMALYTYC